MNNKTGSEMAVKPPKMIQAVASGFNSVANHIYLILMPIVLDLMLLFNPKISLKNVLGPYMEQAIQNLVAISSADMMEMVNITSEVWKVFINEYNFFSLIKTFPIGIPSLISGQPIDGTPAGISATYNINSWVELVSSGFLLILAGILVGSIFWGEVQRKTSAVKRPFSFNILGWQVLQSYILTAALLLILLFFLVPSSFIVSLITIFSPFFAQLFFLVSVLVMIWVIIPLFFSPHGIFALKQNVFTSIKTSYRLVRLFLPGTGLFLVLILLMSQGLNTIWLIPPTKSWLILVGIAGHAYISTSLLAASFNYYEAGMDWMNAIIEQRASAQKANIQSLSN